MKVKVVRVTQSPLNSRRWSLELSCGHETWITSDSRPKRRTYDCGACSALTSALKGLR